MSVATLQRRWWWKVGRNSSCPSSLLSLHKELAQKEHTHLRMSNHKKRNSMECIHKYHKREREREKGDYDLPRQKAPEQDKPEKLLINDQMILH